MSASRIPDQGRARRFGRRALGVAVAAGLVVPLAVAGLLLPRAIPSGAATVDLTGVTLDGERLSLAEARGSVVVLNVWASWCFACREEALILARLDRRLGDEVRFVGVNIGDTRAEARAFRARFGIDYATLFDPSSELQHRLGTRALPATFVLDRSGRITFRRFGPIGERELNAAIEAAVRGSPKITPPSA